MTARAHLPREPEHWAPPAERLGDDGTKNQDTGKGGDSGQVVATPSPGDQKTCTVDQFGGETLDLKSATVGFSQSEKEANALYQRCPGSVRQGRRPAGDSPAQLRRLGPCAADQMIEATGGKGEVAILLGAAGNNVTTERAKGFKDRIKVKAPDLQWCSSRRVSSPARRAGRSPSSSSSRIPASTESAPRTTRWASAPSTP